jgi:hypothetical protein
MTVPYTFGTATTSIPLSNLDSNFNTPITLGNTSIYLGNTTTTIGNLTLTNATISSGSVTISNVTVTTANVTNITVSGTTTLSGLTASTALALDASKNVVSVTNTGTGNNVLSASPTLTGTIAGASLSLSSLTSGRVTFAGASGLLSDSASLTFDGTSLTTPRLVLGGTTLPSAGTATLFSRTSDNNTYLQTGSGNNVIFLDGSQNTMATLAPTLLTFLISGAEKMRITSAGLVGIGTSSPSALLSVSTSTMTNQILIGQNASASTYGAISFNGVNTDAGRSGFTGGGGDTALYYDVPGGIHTFRNAGTTQMILNASGNLGLGTTSPVSNAGYTALTISNTTGAQIYWKSTTSVVTAYAGADSNGGYIATSTSHPLIFRTVDTERMRIDSSGNLGLGVTPSASNLPTIQSTYGLFTGNDQVNIQQNAYYNSGFLFTGTGYATQYQQLSGEHRWKVSTASGTAGNAITFTQAMTLDASGNLLVGVTSAYSGSANAMYSANNSTWVFRPQSGATSSPNGILIKYSGASPNDSGNQFLYCEDSGGDQRMSVRSNGGIANYATNNVILSDRREKTNFTPATPYLDKICAIPVQTFNYIDQNLEEDGGLTLGVVAQDVQAVAPELVSEGNWGTKEEPKMRLEIYQTDLQYALMKCIQEQQALIESLTTRLTALENK